MTGMTIIPFMPWIMRPMTSGKGVSSLSMAALSSTPPPATHLSRPATAKTTAVACTATSTATA
jgi:hypothetical protein